MRWSTSYSEQSTPERSQRRASLLLKAGDYRRLRHRVQLRPVIAAMVRIDTVCSQVWYAFVLRGGLQTAVKYKC